MAKTQKDYEAEGGKMFREGKPAPLPVSWQSKAQMRGYADARAVHTACGGLTLVNPKPRVEFATVAYGGARSGGKHKPIAEIEEVQMFALTDYMPHGTAAHVVDLQRQLRNNEMQNTRYWRIRSKITKLQHKYSARAARE